MTTIMMENEDIATVLNDISKRLDKIETNDKKQDGAIVGALSVITEQNRNIMEKEAETHNARVQEIIAFFKTGNMKQLLEKYWQYAVLILLNILISWLGPQITGGINVREPLLFDPVAFIYFCTGLGVLLLSIALTYKIVRRDSKQ